MARKRHKAEEIVAKLRQVEVLTAQGRRVAEAIRLIGVTEVGARTAGLSGISCARGHDGKGGDIPGPDAKNFVFLRRSWTSCLPEAMRRRSSIRTAFLTN